MTETLVIALAVMLPLCVIVLLLVRQAKKQAQKSKKKLRDLYQQIVSQNKLDISFMNETDNKIFALDAQRKTLVYLWYYGELMYDIIDLTIINECSVKRSGDKEEQKGKQLPDMAVNRVSISLYSLGVEVFDILVYSEINDGVSEKLALLELAGKWQKAITEVIPGK